MSLEIRSLEGLCTGFEYYAELKMIKIDNDIIYLNKPFKPKQKIIELIEERRLAIDYFFKRAGLKLKIINKADHIIKIIKC